MVEDPSPLSEDFIRLAILLKNIAKPQIVYVIYLWYKATTSGGGPGKVLPFRREIKEKHPPGKSL
jgi:hypothetical protein